MAPGTLKSTGDNTFTPAGSCLADRPDNPEILADVGAAWVAAIEIVWAQMQRGSLFHASFYVLSSKRQLEAGRQRNNFV